jgi:hypothetical protein
VVQFQRIGAGHLRANLALKTFFVLRAGDSGLIRLQTQFERKMNTISGKIIDRTWKRINESTPEDVQRMTAKLFENQPFAGAYLMAVEETLLPESERGNLLFIALILWEIMSSGREPLRKITQDDIETAEAANVKFLEDLEAGSEMDHMEALQRLMTTYNQGPLLAAVVDGLMADDEEDPDSAPDSIGIALLHLKTILDCWDKC